MVGYMNVTSRDAWGSFRVTNCVIINANFVCGFFELNGNKWTFILISFVKRIQNDVQDDVMRDAK